MTAVDWAVVAGVGIVAWFVIRKPGTATNQAAFPSQTTPAGSVNLLTAGAGFVGGTVGGIVGGAVGAGPAASIFRRAGSDFAQAEVSAWKTTASGVSDLAHGNIGSGLKEIGEGAVGTAAAPITGLIHTIGGLF